MASFEYRRHVFAKFDEDEQKKWFCHLFVIAHVLKEFLTVYASNISPTSQNEVKPIPFVVLGR